ncbi:hypothetical protein SNE40_018988 [Patella caerulea]|uniref:Uncharacterized protein n=1 Tax=Patella caerulea TaxID=87958 RepID=A0AAN8P9G4_PATCE
MEAKQFIALQGFELLYLLVLVFLPYVIAQKIVGLTIVFIASVMIVTFIIKNYLTKMIDIDGKTVLVTGCDSGFGNAIAQRLDFMGFTVYAGCQDLKSDGVERLTSSTSGRMHVIPLDVTDDKSINECYDEVYKACSTTGLWALINNAGINFVGDVELTPLNMYRQVAEVNLFGVINMSKTFLPLIRKAKGRIINTTSAPIFPPSQSACAFTKNAVEAFSDCLRLEMRQFGVKVSIIEPGNFYGSTGMLGEKSVSRMRQECDEMWDKASHEVKTSYGRDYVEAQYSKNVDIAKKTTCTTLAPVVDAMENAVMNTNPSIRYLVDGSNQWYDYNNVLVRLKPYLPANWIDNLIDRSYILKHTLTNKPTRN